MFEVLFKDGPPEPLSIPQEIKDKAKREFGLNCENFYNIAVAGIAGTGKVSNHQMFRVRLGEGEGIAFENQYKLLPRMGCKDQYDLQLVMMEYSGCCGRMISTCYSYHSRSNYTLLFTVFRCQWDNGHARQ